MSDFSLTLGPVAFAGFELPSSITVGGRQRLAIHRLPGGIRIIDALGADPTDINFSVIFTRPYAADLARLEADAPEDQDDADRARLLDALRVAGAPLPLAWDAFIYTVIVESFEADYRSPWWIPYRLSCTVLRDEAASLVAMAVEFAPAISSDLLAAGSFATNATMQTSVPGATITGTAANAAAQASLTTTLASIDNQITTTTASLNSLSLSATVSAAGLLAQLTAARAYTARAARNLSSAST